MVCKTIYGGSNPSATSTFLTEFRLLSQKKLSRGILLIVVANLIVKLVWVFVESKVQNEVGHEEFGKYTSIWAWAVLLQVISDFGLRTYNTKNVAEKNPHYGYLFRYIFSLKSIFSALYILILLAFGIFIQHYSQTMLLFMVLVASGQAFMEFVLFFRGNFKAFQDYTLDAFASITDKLIQLVIVIFLLMGKITISQFIWTYLISTGSTFVIFLLISLKKYGWHRPKFNTKRANILVRKSFPFALMTILGMIHQQIDITMLEKLTNYKEVGLYRASTRFIEAILMYLWTILPLFFARFATVKKDTQATQKLLRFALPIVALPIIFIFGFVQNYSELFTFMLKQSNPSEIELIAGNLKILIIYPLILAFFEVYSTILTAGFREKEVSVLLLLSTILNIILNAIFIPKYGSIAASWTTITSYIFLTIGYLYLISTKTAVKIEWKIFLKTIIITSIFLLSFHYSQQLNWHWILVSILNGILLILLFFILKLLSKKLIQ